MINKKQIKQSVRSWLWFICAILSLSLFSGSALAWDINLELVGTEIDNDLAYSGPAHTGQGDYGLYLDVTNYNYHSSKENWSWERGAVSMVIDEDTGNATITGNSPLNYNGSRWDVTIELTDAHIKGDFNTQSGFHKNVVNDLIANADNSNRGSSGIDSIGWKTITMNVVETSSVANNWVGSSYYVPGKNSSEEWEGKNWSTSYDFDADLRVVNGQLRYDAWYYNPTYYKMGESKANAYVVPDQTPVPEPSTYALFSLGLIGLGLAKRRQKLTDKN